ncbi:DUF6440 family protein [Enterococcus sp. DIV1420a]|uniref:DUF6440 family protein n=1 Tax=Enterococcus sp. DIV1420a TaxID=2774672 RepID=UPI003F6874E9
MKKESESLTQLGYKIVVDTVTGVNYLESPRGGITPLLDETGVIVIDSSKNIIFFTYSCWLSVSGKKIC